TGEIPAERDPTAAPRTTRRKRSLRAPAETRGRSRRSTPSGSLHGLGRDTPGNIAWQNSLLIHRYHRNPGNLGFHFQEVSSSSLWKSQATFNFSAGCAESSGAGSGSAAVFFARSPQRASAAWERTKLRTIKKYVFMMTHRT